MGLWAFFLCLAATHGTGSSGGTIDRDPEKGPEILPQDEDSSDDLDDIDNVEEAVDEGETEYVQDDNTDDPLDPHNPRLPRRLSSATALTSFSTLVDKPSWFQKVWGFIFPPKEDIDSFIPNYRLTPIISGLLIPFSILLEIPGLTSHWNIHKSNQIVENHPNSTLLNAGLGVSLACAIVANVSLIMRFLERRVETMTIICIAFLAIHDLINITGTIAYSVEHPLGDGFTYGQSFWMTVCSTVVSSLTIATLVWDLWRTPDFNKSGSGLTRKQRTLVIVIMILFCYICFGALINSLLQKLSFINGLYFTLVTIETIGFGDIVPETTGSRVFVCIYAAFGLLNLGVAIGMCREIVLEAMEVAYRRRVHTARRRWKENRKRRRTEAHWRHGIEWRLREMRVPIWVPEDWLGDKAGRGVIQVFTRCLHIPRFLSGAAEWAGFTDRKFGSSQTMHGPTGMRLNLHALSHAQLEASALEAGAPLDALLPPDFIPATEETSTRDTDANVESNSSVPSVRVQHPLTPHPDNVSCSAQARFGGISAPLNRFASHNNATALGEPLDNNGLSNQEAQPANEAMFSKETSKHLPAHPPLASEAGKDVSHLDFKLTRAESSDDLDLRTMQNIEKKRAFRSKLIIAWILFFVFWTTGSAIFMATEGWSYGISMYFCFVAFTTIGYGDYTPTTPAGRSIFIVWAILGVGTMTILISVIQEAYASTYKGSVHVGAFNKAVKRYRQRVQYKKPGSGQHGYQCSPLRGGTNSSSFSQGNQSRSHTSSVVILSQETTQSQKTNTNEPPTSRQTSLEALLGHVLHHAKILHKCSWYYADGGNILDIQGGHGDRSEAVASRVSDILRRQLDDVAVSGGIGRATKEEVMQDPSARHTLFVLSIEKALYKIIDAAERAMEVVQERDVPATQMQDQHELTPNELDLEDDNHNGASSSSNPVKSINIEGSLPR